MDLLLFGILVINLLSSSLMSPASAAVDYCNASLCPKNVQHIACGNSGNFASTCPADAAMVSMTADLKNLLVKSHNEKRNIIAGGGDKNHSAACRMATMQWDNELASIAALNVRQCAMKHDKCRNTAAFQFAGQNLAWMGFTGTVNHAAKLQQAVDMWYNEVKDSRQSYINSYPSSYSGPAIGHFTVMMADRNIRLGCAASTYFQSGYINYLVACNYATTNMINFPIYASCPKAAAKCTTGTNPNFKNLCSASEVYQVNKWF